MLTNENFIEMIMSSFTLNKAQFKILGLPYPPDLNWESVVLAKNISQDEANLLILLKGKLAIKAQEQIIKNYNIMKEFNNLNNKEIAIKDETNTIITKTKNITIYCDGACLGNPGEAGSGLTIYDDNTSPTLLYGDYIKFGTNNIAELNALYKALLIASESETATIFSDSQYSIDCITKWAYSWKSNSWRKKGGDIKNLDIIKIAHELYDNIKNRIEVKHVKAHSGIEGNELADRMAVFTINSKNKNYKEYSYDSTNAVLNLSSY